MDTKTEYALAARDDISTLKAEFEDSGRLQIPGWLDPQDARHLRDTLLEQHWRTVLNEGPKHFDIHPDQAELLGPQRMVLLKREATRRAASQFQYFYENFPVHESIEAGTEISEGLIAAHRLMNSDAARGLIGEITGTEPDFCDMQATRYRAGHFLTKHNDDVDGKHRRFAYVLGLSQRWRRSWGGNLEFLKPDGTSDAVFTPRFNTLSLFRVPMDHHVTPVKPVATSSRLSMTGWFRMKP